MGGLNWGEGAKGAISGGAKGAAAGPEAAAALAVIEGGIGLFKKKKKKKKPKTLSSLDEKQKKLNEEQYAALRGEGPLADLYKYDPVAANKVFDENIAKYAYRNLNESGIPGVTGQFRKQGLMQSSYAGDAVAKLVRDVQENLNAKRSEYLYNTEQASKEASRNAVEKLQNRQTFAYDTAPKTGGGNPLNQILSSFSPQDMQNAGNWLQDVGVNYLPGGVN
jgi:hypothetical protein